MSRLILRLLGPLSVEYEPGKQVTFAYDKVRALFSYLVTEHDRSHDRKQLAALLWPESSENAARHSLNQAVSSLRRSLELAPGDVSTQLVVDRARIQFRVDDATWLDLREFDRLSSGCGECTPSHASVCEACQEKLERAEALVLGEFLEGLIVDEHEFQLWLEQKRSETHAKLSRIRHDLLAINEQKGETSQAIELARHLIATDRWDEPAYRSLMRLLAASGQRSAAIRQFVRCRDALQQDLGIEPDAETVRVYEEIRRSSSSRDQVVASRNARSEPSRKLPTYYSSFVGRGTELDTLWSLLEADETRLITMTGPGGIGKTRLAVQFAGDVSSRFHAGVCFVPLAGLQSSAWLAASILSTLSGSTVGSGDEREQLLSYLESREMLLVLDNFEHLLDGTGLVGDMIERAPGLTILVTSRERLNLSSEWVLELDGLPVPAEDARSIVEAASAASMFLLAARRHSVEFEPHPDDWQHIARICRLTEGAPLAIELAAAWIPALTPSGIADEIERGIDFLESGTRDLPTRHRSIRTIFEHSWDLLTPNEQQGLRRISIFAGGFQRAAAEYVTGTSLAVLSALVSKSFIKRNPDGRYEIHEFLRQLAEERFEEAGQEPEQIRARHRDFYLGFMAVREEQLRGSGLIRALNEITTEHENIRAAWHYAIESSDLHGISRASPALWLFYEVSGRYREGFELADLALSMLDRIYRPDRDSVDDHLLARARVLQFWDSMAYRLGYSNSCYGKLEESARLLLQHDRIWDLSFIRNCQAVCARDAGDHDLEEGYLLLSIEDARRAGHRWVLAYSLNDLGALRLEQGRLQEAQELTEQGLSIFEDLGDVRGTSFALRNLGLISSSREELDSALEHLFRSLEIRQTLGMGWGIADSLKHIGIVNRSRGDLEDSYHYLLEARESALGYGAFQILPGIEQELDVTRSDCESAILDHDKSRAAAEG